MRGNKPLRCGETESVKKASPSGEAVADRRLMRGKYGHLIRLVSLATFFAPLSSADGGISPRWGESSSRGRQFPYRLTAFATSPIGGSIREEQYFVWLPTGEDSLRRREMSAKPTKGGVESCQRS